MEKIDTLHIGILLRNRHDGPGGLEKVLEIIARAMPEKNVELFFYSLYPIKYGVFTKGFKNLRYLSYPSIIERFATFLPSSLARALRKAYVWFQGYQLFEMMQADQIDTLITMDLSKQFLGNYQFLKAFKVQSGVPIFSWVHSSLSGNSADIVAGVKSKIDIFDGHLAISSGIADEIEQNYLGKNISIIYNPVEEAPLVIRDKSKFIYIGRIDKNKRVHSILTHLLLLKGKWHLDIYGSTGNREEDKRFQSYIDSLGLSARVTFHGWKKNVWAEIDSAGIILLNSRREGFPLVLVEAMIRGIPALSSNCPTGPADIIIPGENGWLYPVNEENKIQEYLQKILDGELELPSPEAIQANVQGYEMDNYLDNILVEIGKLKR